MFPAQANGLGFNPILQDPALAIHPPLLYIGYVGFSAAFSFSIATLTLENNEKITCVGSDKPLPYRLRINQSCDCSHESYGFCDFRNTSRRGWYR
jgi:hypothetical protein